MVRFLIIGAVIAAAITIYGIIDAAMTDSSRARGVSKPVWILLLVLLPLVGAVLWLTVGKNRGDLAQEEPRDPVDFSDFEGARQNQLRESRQRIDDLEERLRELDSEKFPGEEDTPGDTTPGDKR